jgi:2-deoxy-D-gluconate 3-dehydrogenase
VAVVTGGNGGIGLGMGRGLAEAGAAVVVAARNRDKSGRAVAELRGLGAESEAIEVDVADEGSVEALVKATVGRFGRLDILVNNAGMNIRKPVESLKLDEWHQVLDVNLTSAFLASRACYPVMKKQGRGKIINIGSMMSIFGASFAPAYAASKGGMVQLTKAMAAGWAVDNIQVNAVLPGWIDTELTQRARQQIEGLHESVLRRTPAKRWGIEQDMAGVAVFLASSASDFVTGAAITVDGGYSILG